MSLRGLAKATADGTYKTSMQARVAAAKGEVDKIVAAGGDAVKGIGGAIGDIKADMAPDQVGDIPDKVAAAVKKFAEDNDGSNLASIDGLLPKPDQYKGSAQP